jgi:hypothetical protein
MVDEFILYDDRQFTKRDWRNRNVIKTAQGPRWLTIPVQVKGRYTQRIDETLVSDLDWPNQHWQVIAQSYRAAPHFKQLEDTIGSLYAAPSEQGLSEINRRFLDAMCALLGIRTRLTWSMDYPAEGSKTDRLVSLCRLAGATDYLSGPAAKAYIEDAKFEAAGVELTYMDYSGYREYPQLHGNFEHGVSIIDLLFNTGEEAPTYLKSFGARVVSP